MMKRIRQLHLYLGVFFAPAIVFFSLSGAFQTFGWHENKGGATHPAWIAKIGEIHKHQKIEERKAQKRPPAGQRPPQRPRGEENETSSALPLKIFVFLMSLGLIVTTALGVYMAFSSYRDRRMVWALLVAGTVLPIALLAI